jgi:hypothetical protein
MTSRWMRSAGLAALLALAPAAKAFETVDTLPWPSAGRFPAYPGEGRGVWSINAYGGSMYDSNILREADNEVSDFVTRLGVGGSYTARVVGRQSILLDGYAEYRKYSDLDQFDHWAYGVRGLWLWEIGNQLAGTVGVRRVQRLADLGESSSNRRDIITTDYLDATGAYRFHPDFRLTGGIGTNYIQHDGRDIATTRNHTARGGIEYVSGLGNTLGVEYRRSRGDAPVDEFSGFGVVLPDNEYDEEEIAVTLFYSLSAQLRVRGRLGHTERTYDQIPAADFSGTTGRGAIEWLPGPKVLITLEAFREPDPVIDAEALYIDRRGVAAGVAWAVTYKVVLSVRALQERRLYRGDPFVFTGLPQRDETVHLLTFGAGWEVQRHWQLSAALDYGTRDSNFLGRDYDYTAITANLRWQF